jgi:hypothetical protein
MIELINERHFSDWSAIYSTPDSRLYRRLIALGWTEAAGKMRESERSDDEPLLLSGVDEV